MLLDYDMVIELASDPFACWLSVDVGDTAHALRSASALTIVGDLLSVPVPVFEAEEISEAFDTLLYERTIRVGTDLSWSLT